MSINQSNFDPGYPRKLGWSDLPHSNYNLSNSHSPSWYPSSLLNTCLYHLTPFAFAIWTTVSFNHNISIRSSVFFFSISFVPHIAHTIALSVLLKIAISFSFKHHVSLPFNISDPTQLRYTIPFILSENLFEFSNSLHYLNFTHPILALAVTAASQPPLAFILSPKWQNLSLFPPLHTTPPPVLLIHHQLTSCIFHIQNFFPTLGSLSLLLHIYHVSISRISHTTLNLPLLPTNTTWIYLTDTSPSAPLTVSESSYNNKIPSRDCK